MSTRRNLLNIIIILCVCNNWACIEGALKKERVKGFILTLLNSALFSLQHHQKASKTKSSMHVVHRYGSSSSLATKSPDHADILSHNQALVNSIHDTQLLFNRSFTS